MFKIVTTLCRFTVVFEDNGLALHPEVTWKVVGSIFCLVFDCHSVDEPIAIDTTAIILQRNHQKLADIFCPYVVVVLLSSFEVIVEPFVQGQRISLTIGT